MTTALAPSTLPPGIPTLQLLPGERVVHEGVPSGVLRLASLAGTTLLSLITVFGIPFLPLFWWLGLRQVAVHRYWLTDRRLVVRTGIIGYQIRSIPLSRIVDVSTRASWFDRLLGLTHIHVRDMTGESAGEGVSRGVRLLGVQDPETWAASILTRSTSTAAPGATSPPVAARDGAQLDTVVSLLQTLVDRAA